MILPLLFAQTSPDGESNVTLDDERLQEGVPKGLQKVELDLDDALFLEFEEKEEEPEPEPEPEPEAPAPLPVVQEQKAPPRSRKKLLIFGIAAVLCLLLGAGGAYFFMKSGTEQPREVAEPEPQPAQGEHADTAATKTTPENATAKPVVLVAHPMARFQVEYALADQIRFLTCRLVVTNITELMRLELETKSVLVRDGVYRYLKNAPLSFLDNPANSDKLKQDLAQVINQHLKSGQIDEILIEEYVVR